MNVVVKNSNLSQELKLLSRVSAAKTTIPVLSYVLLETNGDSLNLSATDLEIGLRTRCQATITEPGETTLPTKRLLDLLEQLPDGEVKLTLEKEQVLITAGGFRSRIQTYPAKDFPKLPEIEGTAAMVSAPSLNLLVERARYAITDKADTRFLLTGALFSLSGTVMALVSTDGKRLSLATAVRSPGPEISLILPSKTMDLLTSLCESGDVEVSQSGKHLFFVTGQRTLISRMLEGQFPKYEKIIPRDSTKKINVDRSELASVVRRMNVLADDQQTVQFELEENVLRITTRNAGIGDGNEELSVIYEGEPVVVRASGKHILDFLERASEKTIMLAFKDNKSPILMTDGSDFLNVVLVRT